MRIGAEISILLTFFVTADTSGGQPEPAAAAYAVQGGECGKRDGIRGMVKSGGG